MDQRAQIGNILAASGKIDPVFLATPVLAAATLDDELGCRVLAKSETQNPIGSFKGRGTEFFAKTALRPGEEIVCASAGNFGQGLARAATRRGHACTVFAAHTANRLKLDAMARLGAKVKLSGEDFDAAKEAAKDYAAERGLRYVEDGAEPAIAEGAGTIGLELAATHHFDVILVQLGNGALLSGVGTAIRHAAPQAEIIAVVAEKAPAMKLSLEAGSAVATSSAATIADGMAVREPIPSSPAILRGCYDRVVAVSEDNIFAAMKLIHKHLGLILEPSGAVGLSAIIGKPEHFRGRTVAIILCGSNISIDLRERLLTGSTVS